jgi:hypothetical protein
MWGVLVLMYPFVLSLRWYGILLFLQNKANPMLSFQECMENPQAKMLLMTRAISYRRGFLVRGS